MDDIKNLKGLEIFLGYTCNVKCTFCYQKNLRQEYVKFMSFTEVQKLLDEGVRSDKKFVIFSGGEPTLDRNLPEYISYSRSLGYKHIRVHTNGFGFQNESYLLGLYQRGLTGVVLSVHGYENIHNHISGKQSSFEAIKKSLVHFEKLIREEKKFVVDINTVVCKQNYKHLYKLIIFLCKFSINRIQLAFSYDLGLFNEIEKRKIIIPYNIALPYLRPCFLIGEKYRKKILIENVPYCLLEEADRIYILGNYKPQRKVFDLKNGSIEDTEILGKIKTAACKGCKFDSVCSGLPLEYLQYYKTEELLPM